VLGKYSFSDMVTLSYAKVNENQRTTNAFHNI